MATRLVYHKPGAVEQTFPYDVPCPSCSRRRGGDFACPYVKVDYLPRQGCFILDSARCPTTLTPLAARPRDPQAGRSRRA